LGTLEGNSYAVAINDAGQIVGSSYLKDGSIQHAFLYDKPPMLDIGFSHEGSYAVSINNQGDILIGTGFPEGAFLYRHEELLDLNASIDSSMKLILGAPSAINDRGQILTAGHYYYEGGASGAFLLTPIPEPPSLILLSIGISFFCACVQYHRLRKNNSTCTCS
jgi:probable HAF family extracellular repeat protein